MEFTVNKLIVQKSLNLKIPLPLTSDSQSAFSYDLTLAPPFGHYVLYPLEAPQRPATELVSAVSLCSVMKSSLTAATREAPENTSS